MFRTKPIEEMGSSPTQGPSPTRAGQGEPAVIEGIFEPPESATWSAIKADKVLVIAIALLGAVVGIAIGLTKPPTYEASTTLEVGRVSPNSPSFYGFTQSASSLATAFSRSIAAAPVLREVEEK